MGSLRTKEAEEHYRKRIAEGVLEGPCILCEKEAIESFASWKIVENDFPYDLVAKTHHMIVPLRHASESEVTVEEWKELQEIKKSYIFDNYEYIIDPVPKKKSIPEHFHLHLIVSKD